MEVKQMKVYPAIDLIEGKAVRLLRGDYNKMDVYSVFPEKIAAGFEKDGATRLHVVDLDGAKDGGTPNFELITRMVKSTKLFVEVGGGIRDMDTARKYLDCGVSRIILGTAAVTDEAFLEEAVKTFGDKVAIGVDVKDEKLAIHGWTEESGINCFDFCEKLEKLGVSCVICTDISRDGAMEGVNTELYRRLTEKFKMEIVASGGVTTLDDLDDLRETGVAGAILGKSLYTGRIQLRDALARARFKG